MIDRLIGRPKTRQLDQKIPREILRGCHARTWGRKTTTLSSASRVSPCFLTPPPIFSPLRIRRWHGRCVCMRSRFLSGAHNSLSPPLFGRAPVMRPRPVFSAHRTPGPRSTNAGYCCASRVFRGSCVGYTVSRAKRLNRSRRRMREDLRGPKKLRTGTMRTHNGLMGLLAPAGEYD